MQATTLAAHRFGLGEPELAPLRADPQGWVLAQFKPDALAALRVPPAAELLSSADALSLGRRVLRASLQAAASGAAPAANATAASIAGADLLAPGPDRDALRREGLRAVQWRWQQSVASNAPVAERWAEFWFNHFCVAATKGSMLGMVWPFEREAIRPRVGGRFVDLLMAATTHPSMLLYLDNAQSVGPNAAAQRRAPRDSAPDGVPSGEPPARQLTRRLRGLNENHARELLELHTLGVDGGYTQADVTELARLMTGWSVRRDDPRAAALDAEPPAAGAHGAWPSRFYPAQHEPGTKRVLGQVYPEGADALAQVLGNLARHPATARHLATKLVRHFVADEPPAALVDAVAERWRVSDGDLPSVAEALFRHPAAWSATGAKFKTPQELLLSAHRVVGHAVSQPERWVQLLTQLGQTPGRAPSPQGWPDRAEDWLAPDALWKRVEWASGFAANVRADLDVRQRADTSFGADLSSETRRQIHRAESGTQALALFLASPEFQRR